MEYKKKFLEDEKLRIFKAELLKANRSLNLFSRKRPNFQLDLLFEGGFASAEILSERLKAVKGPILDLGSGNGFPGLFFALLFPYLKFHLCERSRKKAEFLKYISSRMKVLNAKILCLSADELQNPYEIILSQAAFPLKKAYRLLNQLLLPSGRAFLWQGPYKGPEEPMGEKMGEKTRKNPVGKTGTKTVEETEKWPQEKFYLKPSKKLHIRLFKSYKVQGLERQLLELSKKT